MTKTADPITGNEAKAIQMLETASEVLARDIAAIRASGNWIERAGMISTAARRVAQSTRLAESCVIPASQQKTA